MSDNTLFEETFTSDTLPEVLTHAHFEACTFEHCDLSKQDLSHVIFEDCSFYSCNLSLAKMGDTAWRNVHFTDCKMLGLHWEHANAFGLECSFTHCTLDQNIFTGMDLRSFRFQDTSLKHADFSDANGAGISFNGCDFSDAYFENTRVENTDFSQSLNLSIRLPNNHVKGARFRLDQAPELLRMFGVVIS